MTDASSTRAESDLPGERHVPLTTPEVVELCTRGLGEADAAQFSALADRLGAVLHATYRDWWRNVKTLYLEHSPDRRGPDPDERLQAVDPETNERFVSELRTLLDAANYDAVPREALERALSEESVFRVRLEVDLDHYEELLLFRRGAADRQETVKRWYGLRRKEIRFIDYRRVVMYARYRDAAYFRKHDIDVEKLNIEPGRAFMKQFRDVPEADLEMLLPNTDVRMRTVDKLVIGVPAAIGGVVIAATKLVAAAGLLVLLLGAWLGFSDRPADLSFGRLATLLGGLVAFGAYVWRQWSKFKNRRIHFMKTLSENLYVKTLADGPGVLFSVLDAAEEEDTKEALLAYRCLLDGPRTAEELDDAVESWLREDARVTLDFEVSDAIAKLAALGIARPEGERCAAATLADAAESLLRIWARIGETGKVPALR